MVQTTASQLPLKAQLMDVDLEGSEAPPLSVEEQEAQEEAAEELAQHNRSAQHLNAIHTNHLAMQAQHMASCQKLIAQQMELLQQAQDLMACQDTMDNPSITKHQELVAKQQAFLSKAATDKAHQEAISELTPTQGPEESMEDAFKRMEAEDCELDKLNHLLQMEAAACQEFAHAQDGAAAMGNPQANTNTGLNTPAHIMSVNNHQEEHYQDAWEEQDDLDFMINSERVICGSGDLDESMVSDPFNEHGGANSASSSSTNATDTGAGMPS
jgi:hypothetical protein